MLTGRTSRNESPRPPSSLKSESSGGSKRSHISTLSERLSKLDEEPGYNQVLRPEQYRANGRKAQKALRDAIDGNKADKKYPSYTERYEIIDEEEIIPNGELEGQGIGPVLEKVGLDGNTPWKYIELVSKGNPDDPVLIAMFSKEQKSMILLDSKAAADKDPDSTDGKIPQRLPNGELAKQLFQYTAGENEIPKWSVRHPVANKGSLLSLKDAHHAKGISPDVPGIFIPEDGEQFNQVLGEGFEGASWDNINGIVNVKPQTYMLADHHNEFHNAQIVALHTFPRLPESKNFGSLVVELAHP